MGIEVFNRIEKKYKINQRQLDLLTTYIEENMTLDANNKDGKPYTITNLYYDTNDNFLIRNSIAKPTYKEKLRVRAYGSPDTTDKVYVEIKKKIDGVVSKRRTSMLLSEAYAFLNEGHQLEEKKYMNKQVMKELGYFMKVYDVSPKVYLAYDRLAYFGTSDPDLRISFDLNIRYREDCLNLEAGDFGNRVLPEDIYLMEVKTSKAMPTSLCAILAESKIYPSSFSKYGYIYQNFMRDEYRTSVYKSVLPRQQQLQPNIGRVSFGYNSVNS